MLKLEIYILSYILYNIEGISPLVTLVTLQSRLVEGKTSTAKNPLYIFRGTKLFLLNVDCGFQLWINCTINVFFIANSSHIEVNLVWPWKEHVNIEYIAKAVSNVFVAPFSLSDYADACV